MLGQLFPSGGGLPIALLKERVIVGRSSECDVIVPSRAMSGRHCALLFRSGYWWVKDLESRNGTGINGKKVQEKRILPNETLCVPKMRFRVVYEAPRDEAQMSDESMAMNILAEPPPESASPSLKRVPRKVEPPRKKQNPPSSDVVEVRPEPEPTKSRDTNVSRQSTAPGTQSQTSDSQPANRYLGKLTPNGGGVPIALLTPNLIVGRSSSSNIRLKVATVSSRHCSLTYEDGYWFVEDLGSSNGVRVNGEQVDRRILMPGDQLAISTKRFVIEYAPVGEPPRDSNLFSKSLLEKAGLANILDSDQAPAWITSHETHDNDGPRKYRLDDSDPG